MNDETTTHTEYAVRWPGDDVEPCRDRDQAEGILRQYRVDGVELVERPVTLGPWTAVSAVALLAMGVICLSGLAAASGPPAPVHVRPVVETTAAPAVQR